MRTFGGITEAVDSLNEWFWSSKEELPEDVVSEIQPLLSMTRSPVDAAVQSTEVLYAHMAELDHEALAMLASLAELCQVWGYHQMDLEQRGYRIALSARQASGEKLQIEFEAPDIHHKFRSQEAL